MNKKALDKFKQVFEKQRDEILKQTSEPTELDVDGDEMDKAQGDVLNSIMDQLSRRNIQKLDNIDKALKKIKDGTFGECEECEGPISEKRLLAKPDADTCITCAERLECVARQYAS